MTDIDSDQARVLAQSLYEIRLLLSGYLGSDSASDLVVRHDERHAAENGVDLDRHWYVAIGLLRSFVLSQSNLRRRSVIGSSPHLFPQTANVK